MKSDRWKQLDKILGLALEVPRENRTAFIEDACGDDRALLAEAMEIMEADDEASKFLSEGTDEGQKVLSRAGELIGAYRLLEVIGEGGMGTVYCAERADGAFEKRVALKLMKPGALSGLWRRRFRTERHILGRLEHSRIATLLDGGETETKEPYLVMKLVEGRTIDRYCREEVLSVRDRITLMEKVCGAVAYAHQNLVVHRDLKPGNVMVTDQGEPRLLDFGIAKLLEPDFLEVTVEATKTHLRPMSASYASPEQITGGVITTATDVWALGVLSYEILTYRRPFKASSSLAEIERSRHKAPEAPSRVVSGDRARRQLRGDLDTIVLKALRMEPERRYGTAADLEVDFRRYLAGRPVKARPVSWSYRLTKFLGRNRIPVSLGAVSSAAILGLGVRLLLQSKNLREERDKARQTVDLMVRMLGEASARQGPGEEVTVREAMEAWEPVMREKLKGQEDLLGIVLATTGIIYSEMCLFDEARDRLQEAIGLLGTDNPRDKSRALAELGLIESDADRNKIASKFLHQALAIAEKYEEKESLLVSSILRNLGLLEARKKNWAESEFYLSKGLVELPDSVQGRSNEGQSERISLHAGLHSLLGYCYWNQSRAEKARSHYEVSLRLTENRSHTDKRNKSIHYLRYGSFCEKDLKIKKAEKFFKKALAIQERVLRPGHFDTAITLMFLGRCLRKRGQVDAAILQGSQSQQALAALFDPTHPELGRATIHLAVSLAAGEKWKEMLALLATPEGEALFQFKDYKPGWAVFCLVKAYLALDDFASAEESIQRVEIDEECRDESRAMALLARAELAKVRGEKKTVEALEAEAREAWPKAPIPPHFRAHLTKLFD